MTDMVVLAFENEGGADMGRERLEKLNDEYVLDLVDAVEVVRHSNGKIKIKDIRSLTGIGAMGGAFWEHFSVFCSSFQAWDWPLERSQAIAGHFAHFGVSKEYLKQIETSVTPGTSALAILAANVAVDKVVKELIHCIRKLSAAHCLLNKKLN